MSFACFVTMDGRERRCGPVHPTAGDARKWLDLQLMHWVSFMRSNSVGLPSMARIAQIGAHGVEVPE